MRTVKWIGCVLGALLLALIGSAYGLFWAVFGDLVFRTLGFSSDASIWLALASVVSSGALMVFGIRAMMQAEQYV